MAPTDIRRGWVISLAAVLSIAPAALPAAEGWTRRVVYEGQHCNTAVAGDYSGEGLADVICSAGGKVRLLTAPDWRETILEGERNLSAIHSETLDVDGDGDLDYVGAQYLPGVVFWLERPERPLVDRWRFRLIDDQVQGIHGLLAGDVNGDQRPDLLANSAQPLAPFPNSLVWYEAPDSDRLDAGWARHVFAKGDAPGLSHYLGLGDVDGDGRADAASGAKGGPMAEPGQGDWFAWWRAPADPTQVWKKQLISDKQPGATNIHPADVNGDGRTDFIASRGHGRGVVWFEAPQWVEHAIHEEINGPHCLAVADLDGDGDIDAATCAKDDMVCAWFENDGAGSFATHIVGRNQAAYDIRATDMDRDGDLDLLVAGQASKNVVWYENPAR